MEFLPTPLEGAWLIEVSARSDARGGFARRFCAREFADRGLEAHMVQSNLSWNTQAGTLRGMHYQEGEAAEVKLVSCTRGEIFDVIVDLRPDSPTHLEHFGTLLTAENRRSLYVPRGFAHGYLTLRDASEVSYQVSEFYSPGSERGLHHADPVLGIEWPAPILTISEKDANWASLGSDTPL